MNDHWLKEQFKDTSTDELKAELDQLEAFGGSDGMISTITAELERREQENEPTMVSPATSEE